MQAHFVSPVQDRRCKRDGQVGARRAQDQPGQAAIGRLHAGHQLRPCHVAGHKDALVVPGVLACDAHPVANVAPLLLQGMDGACRVWARCGRLRMVPSSFTALVPLLSFHTSDKTRPPL